MTLFESQTLQQDPPKCGQAFTQNTFQSTLEDRAGQKLKIRINDNRSTWVSIRWESDLTRVSLHRMFLEAPTNVMEELACYIRREHRTLSPTVKAFIEDNRRNLDYSWTVKPEALEHQGRWHNLLEIYDTVNREYFDGKVQLFITWFGEPDRRNKTRVSFGLYQDTLRLIKINRILDKPDVPSYLIGYVIYHEMLHYICPPYLNEVGRQQIHNNEFKKRETLFHQYDQAQQWIDDNKAMLFAN